MDGRKHVVLYIENNQADMQLIKSALEKRGDIQFLMARTAEAGLTIAEVERPDLILLDIRLPGVDRITATTILKLVDATRNIPVVALSAGNSDEEMDRALRSGCHGFLAKPINIQALQKVVDETLQPE